MKAKQQLLLAFVPMHVKTSFILGPVAMIIFLCIFIPSINDGEAGILLILGGTAGTVVCVFIAFFAGCLIYVPLGNFTLNHPANARKIFHSKIPIFALLFACTYCLGFMDTLWSEPFWIAIHISAYSCAVIGWYKVAFKLESFFIENNQLAPYELQ